MRSLLFSIFLLSSFLFAENETSMEIHNVCDSLKTGIQPQVKLEVDHVDEITLYENPHTMNLISIKSQKHEAFGSLKMNVKSLSYSVPVSITAECKETLSNIYEYVKWNEGWSSFSVNNYASKIFDIHDFAMDGLDENNTYNILAMVENQLPKDNAYSSQNLLISKSYEFAFEFWFAVRSYDEIIEMDSEKNVKTHYQSAVSNDSLSLLSLMRKDYSSIPSSVDSVMFQLVKVVLADSRKIVKSQTSSSSEVFAESSSSAVLPTSSSVNGPESSSVIPEESSSSGEPTAVFYRLQNVVEVGKDAVEMRRLDGTVVQNSQNVKPGIYYVKMTNGLWKKKVFLSK